MQDSIFKSKYVFLSYLYEFKDTYEKILALS